MAKPALLERGEIGLIAGAIIAGLQERALLAFQPVPLIFKRCQEGGGVGRESLQATFFPTKQEDRHSRSRLHFAKEVHDLAVYICLILHLGVQGSISRTLTASPGGAGGTFVRVPAGMSGITGGASGTTAP